MAADLLARQFEFNHYAAHANAAGISHAQSLMHPQPGGNCFNWVLGHVVVNRDAVLAALGRPPIWTAEEAAPYARGSRPLAETDARPLEAILEAFDRAQEVIVPAVRALTDADLARPHNENATVGMWLAGLSFHESYHVGQCGILRRILGKEGAIA